jgi:hypothetical protein
LFAQIPFTNKQYPTTKENRRNLAKAYYRIL